MNIDPEVHKWWHWLIGLFVIVALAIATVVTAGGTAAALTVVGAMVVFAKTTRLSHKARSTDKPSWVNRGMVDSSKSALENAVNMLDEKYGIGSWDKGAGSEFSKIIKWLKRFLGLK